MSFSFKHLLVGVRFPYPARYSAIKSNSIIIFAIGTIYLIICVNLSQKKKQQKNTMQQTRGMDMYVRTGESISIVVLVAVVAIVNIITQPHTYIHTCSLSLSLLFCSITHGHLVIRGDCLPRESTHFKRTTPVVQSTFIRLDHIWKFVVFFFFLFTF